MTESFILAVVGSPFGLKGFVKVKSLSGETAHLLSLKSYILRQKGKEKPFTVEETMPTDDVSVFLAKFAGFDSPETAKILAGSEIIAERSLAAPLNNGEFYIEDLKGLQVVQAADSSRVLGHITDIIEGGGGELAEVKLPSGELRLVPFRNEFFGEINIEKGLVFLLQPWILEE